MRTPNIFSVPRIRHQKSRNSLLGHATIFVRPRVSRCFHLAVSPKSASIQSAALTRCAWLKRVPAGRVTAKRISLPPRQKVPRNNCALARLAPGHAPWKNVMSRPKTDQSIPKPAQPIAGAGALSIFPLRPLSVFSAPSAVPLRPSLGNSLEFGIWSFPPFAPAPLLCASVSLWFGLSSQVVDFTFFTRFTFPFCPNPLIARVCTPLHVNQKFFLQNPEPRRKDQGRDSGTLDHSSRASLVYGIWLLVIRPSSVISAPPLQTLCNSYVSVVCLRLRADSCPFVVLSGAFGENCREEFVNKSRNRYFAAVPRRLSAVIKVQQPKLSARFASMIAFASHDRRH
jgi:hypothetical protein